MYIFQFKIVPKIRWELSYYVMYMPYIHLLNSYIHLLNSYKYELFQNLLLQLFNLVYVDFNVS